MSWILDLIVLALIAVGVFLGARRGFVRTAVEVVGCVLILAVAVTVAEPLSEAIYEGSARPAIENAVLVAADGDTGDDEDVDKTFEAMPGAAVNLLGAFGITSATVKKDLRNVSERTSAAIAGKVGDLAAPPVKGLIRVLFVAVCFLIGMILIRLLAGWANKIAERIPVVGTLNRWLGGAAGVLRGLAIAFVAANLLYLLLSVTGGILGITAGDAEQTLLFSHFCWILKS